MFAYSDLNTRCFAAIALDMMNGVLALWKLKANSTSARSVLLFSLSRLVVKYEADRGGYRSRCVGRKQL